MCILVCVIYTCVCTVYVYMYLCWGLDTHIRRIITALVGLDSALCARRRFFLCLSKSGEGRKSRGAPEVKEKLGERGERGTKVKGRRRAAHPSPLPPFPPHPPARAPPHLPFISPSSPPLVL